MDVRNMPVQDKVIEALRRSLPHLPAEGQALVQALLSPESIAIVVGTLVIWAGSHFFGVGLIADAILIALGVVTIGFAVFEGAGELFEFAKKSINASTTADLDQAGRHFARAVVVLGVSVVSAVLLRGAARNMPRNPAAYRPQRMPNVGPAPIGRPRITRPRSLANNSLGETDWFGNIAVSRAQSMTEQRITLLHELVHRFFMPKTGPLRTLRAQLRASSYWRSNLLRYLEEALAEGYAQLRVNGLMSAMQAIRFPIDFGYVTITALRAEGMLIGQISFGAAQFNVFVVEGQWDESQQQ